ncbi:MAG: four helix bundle protein [Planctomycetota bacterium]|jgi:four helix bundle protein
MTESPFPFEKLEVFQLTEQYVSLIDPICVALPRGEAETRSQLKRASLSILNNICEAAGRFGPRDKASFFAIARGSALECAGALFWVRARRLGEPESVDQAIALLRRIGAMLTKLVMRGRDVRNRESSSSSCSGKREWRVF